MEKNLAKSEKKSTQDKSLVFLKASVFALGIVFLVLLSALIILKFGVRKNAAEALQNQDCEAVREIKINGEIAQILPQNDHLLILTKPSNSRAQEVIRVENNCLQKFGRVKFIPN